MVIFKGRSVVRRDVEGAINQYDVKWPNNEYDGWLHDDVYLYAISERGKIYPPKKVLGDARGLPARRLHGGKPTNVLLRRLGFTIVCKFCRITVTSEPCRNPNCRARGLGRVL